MEFRILGPLEVRDDGRLIEIGGRKQRALLAVLLLHANEVVSLDQLIDDLWADAPPATAGKTLQAHVSRLRTALGGDQHAVLETRGRGYVLRLEPGELDADNFVTALETARRALADGDAETAHEILQEALALWRGPPLADFTYERFAQTEIARFEELRVAALEERIDADIALGRHGAVVPELEALVAEHPLRERLLGQLMVALYRSGRQAEALAAYQRARQAFADELGLEPSNALKRLERQILDHDPALLRRSRRGRPAAVPRAAWRHPGRVIGAGAAVLAAVGVAVVLQVRDGKRIEHVAGAIALDRTGTPQQAVPLGSAPANIAVGRNDIWVVDAEDRTISRIDGDDRRVQRTFSTGTAPADVAVGFGDVWIANADDASPGGNGLPQSISRIDADSGDVIATIRLPPSPGGNEFAVISGLSRRRIAVTHDAVWAIDPHGTVSRIDPRTNRRVDTIRNVRAENIAAGDGKIWITEGGAIAQIDAILNAVSRRIDLGAEVLTEIAVGAGAAWVADPFGGKVWRIDEGPTPRRRAIPVGMWVAAVTFAGGAVWATNELQDEIYRIDPRTNAVKVIRGVFAPRSVGADEDGVWVTTGAPPGRDASLPAPVCGPIFYRGSGRPDLLIVADLPLKGAARNTTRAMVQAIRYVLEQRDFDAGGRSVGFQSCDSVTAQGEDSDFFRCGANAKAYARNLRVVAVFGPYQSYCSFLQIPIANRAPEGPLALISPSNTDESLTTDAKLYPTGIRNYVRLAAADHLQAASHAQFVKSRGGRRLFTLTPRSDAYFDAFTANVHAAARRLGVNVIGSARYDAQASDFSSLARRVARADADAVVIAGILVPQTAALIRDVRAAVGTDVLITAPDGFFPIDELIKLTGPEAQGLYVSNYGIPNTKLPRRGRRFLANFAAVYGKRGPDDAAAYGAQGAEIVLDAIARSDGTRASVAAELRRTHVEDGILGDIRFDRNGDLVSAPLTFWRVDARRSVVDRVVTVGSPAPRG